ncbi:sulfur carrier protein ThiS [Acidiphilium sp. PA]|uniref:sulfur carrier protein ThiS n=1 Tax=Acidiphilium sp. PA TaxID=2871705 RepID=UPI002244958C|nr:sulfur carrier protein ThiS [Acidiphilium sp. PA]MCW8308271.1 sulfur carrier protein ThiS [Acidiphilium sp. PA]
MSADDIRVNGAFEPLAPTVAALLAAKGLHETKGLAVALNETLVPKSAWGRTALRAGDQVEIVRAVGGG